MNETCPKCNGRGRLSCTNCNGQGHTRCPSCYGMGKQGDRVCYACTNGTKTCQFCQFGKISCSNCLGSGTVSQQGIQRFTERHPSESGARSATYPKIVTDSSGWLATIALIATPIYGLTAGFDLPVVAGITLVVCFCAMIVPYILLFCYAAIQLAFALLYAVVVWGLFLLMLLIPLIILGAIIQFFSG